MKPRGAVESFLVTASLSGLLFGSLWAVFTSTPAEEATIIGLCFGALVSALSVGKLTEVSRRVTVPDRNLFVADLQGRLAALGFFAKAELPTYRLFESVSEGTFTLGPISMNGVVSRVRMSFDQGGATVVGPRSVLDQLNL